jgi:hypothetical protein
LLNPGKLGGILDKGLHGENGLVKLKNERGKRGVHFLGPEFIKFDILVLVKIPKNLPQKDPFILGVAIPGKQRNNFIKNIFCHDKVNYISKSEGLQAEKTR